MKAPLYLFAVLALAAPAQSPQLAAPAQSVSPAPASAHAHHAHAAPTNLQVLPKTLTGEQVHEIMEKWESELGVECSTCHAADPKNLAPNGKPRLNFADDSKMEKAIARRMVQMVEAINHDYVATIPNSGQAVTCGTCHRGHFGPEPFPAAEHEAESVRGRAMPKEQPAPAR